MSVNISLHVVVYYSISEDFLKLFYNSVPGGRDKLEKALIKSQ